MTIWTDEQKAAAVALISRHEGLALKPYKDTRGFLTIGVGRCLTTRGITKKEAQYLLTNDISGVLADMEEQAWWEKLDAARQIALTDMAFNLGVHGLLAFRKMISALLAQRWGDAAAQMLDSAWAREVGERADDEPGDRSDGATSVKCWNCGTEMIRSSGCKFWCPGCGWYRSCLD